jgi:ribulose-5-phosphate 4-epimerase/fuculose-1-phosphate aldolase
VNQEHRDLAAVADHVSIEADQLALACRVLAGEGLSRVSSGHVSVRTNVPGVIAIRGRPPGDTGLLFASPSDVVQMTMDGDVISTSRAQAPRECFLHLEVFRARPDVQSVVHVHPRWVVALRAAGLDLEPLYGAYDPEGLRLALGDIAYFHSARLIDTPEAGRELAAVLGVRPCCVLDGHGIVSVGDSIEAAVLVAIALDELAQVTCLAAAMGRPRPISLEDQQAMADVVLALRADAGTPGGAVKPTSAAWQHWVERDRRHHAQSYWSSSIPRSTR